MGTIQERKAIERMSQSWRRLTGGAQTASTLPVPEGAAEEVREDVTPPPAPSGAPTRPAG